MISIGAVIIFSGKVALNTYYYFNHDAGLNPIYKLEYEYHGPELKLPPEFHIELSEEERNEQRKLKFNQDLAQYKYSLANITRENLVYLFLFLIVFILHFVYLKNASKKNT